MNALTQQLPNDFSEVEITDVTSTSHDELFNTEAFEKQVQMNNLIQQRIDEKAPRYHEVNELLDQAEHSIECENAAIGKLLHEMRESRLYRVEFDTFEQFMQAKRPSVTTNNLTIRTLMHRMMRKSLGFSKNLSKLRAATALHVAYYNYCWVHGTLKTSPAVAAGIASRPFKFREFYEIVNQIPNAAVLD